MSARIGPDAGTETPSLQLALETVAREHYEVFGEIARGGLGRIMRAHDLRLDRQVAIKELHFRLGNAEARFAREMRLTARLQHPAIVPIHEAGRWPTGEPFYAMKLVEGRTLADVATDATTLEERLHLLPNVIDVAEAIAYAHSERIIHRDLKPHNVLVGSFGETVVIDWGLAKDLDAIEPHEADERPTPTPPLDIDDIDDVPDTGSFHTTDGAVVGTPAFMPPEQARGESVDERADVYSLGALLYQVLAGQRPYAGVPRSELLDAVAHGTPASFIDVAPDVPKDLVAIVDKAMARDPGARYASAAELVDDLRSFTTGQLVGSYDYTVGELLRRFVTREKAAVITAALSVATLLALGIWAFASIADERDQAAANAAEAEQARDLEAEARLVAEARVDALRLEKATSLLETDPTSAVAWLKELRAPLPGAATVAIDAAGRGVARRVFVGHLDRVWTGSFSPDGQLLATGSSDGTVRVWTLDSDEVHVRDQHGDRISSVAFSPDGTRLASSSYDGRVCIIDMAHGPAGPSECGEAHDGAIKNLAWSSNGARLATIGADGTVRVAAGTPAAPGTPDAEGRGVTVRRAPVDRHGQVRFTADDRYVVSGSHQGSVHVWPVDGGEPLVLNGDQGAVTHFDVDPEGRAVATAGEDGTVHLWDLATGTGRVLGRHSAAVAAVAFDPSGRRLASAGLDRRIMVWDLDRDAVVTLEGHGERVGQLAFSPNGQRLASGSWDRTVRLWDLTTHEVQTFRGHEDVISYVAFSPDGETLVSASWDGGVRSWPVVPKEGAILRGHTIGVHTIDVSPDGSRIASGGHDDTVRIWNIDGTDGRVLGRHDDHVFRVRFSPDGRWVASSSDDQTVRLFRADGGASHVLRGHRADVEEIAFADDGRYLASAGEDHRVFLWDVESREGRALEGHSGPVTAVTFSPDGQELASASRDRTVRVWDVATGGSRVFAGHALGVWGIDFSPDGQTLVSASLDDRVLLWDVATGEHQEFADDLSGARLVVFSPDGAKLAVSSSSRRLWICDVDDRECAELRGHSTTITQLVFSADSRALGTASADGTVRLWDVQSGESRVYRGHGAAVFDLALTRDSRWLVSGSADTTVRTWPFGLPPTGDLLGAYLDELTSAVVPAIGQDPDLVR